VDLEKKKNADKCTTITIGGVHTAEDEPPKGFEKYAIQNTAASGAVDCRSDTAKIVLPEALRKKLRTRYAFFGHTFCGIAGHRTLGKA
jgi:hypothetical protein